MHLNRKNFIRSLSLLGGLTFSEIGSLSARVEAHSAGRAIAPDDEAYWSNVRKLFPLTTAKIFLNNGTMGPSPYPVIEAVQKAMMDCDQNIIYRGWEATAERLAQFVAVTADEIALTHNVTEGVNIACWGMPLKKGDEVIMTTHEHVGNALPWLNRQKLHGIIIRTFTPAPTAEETLNRIAALVNRRTRVIAIPHMPCTQGQILPVKEVCALAREKGLYSFIDGAHGPGMLKLDLHDMGCDAYASCCHKWMLGPKGTGFLYVRKDFQDALQSYFVGAGSGDAYWDMTSTPTTMGGYANNAHRYHGGTQAIGLYKGVNAAIDFIESIGMDNINNRVKFLGAYTQTRLLEFGDKIELLTPTEDRSYCAINGFKIRGVESEKAYKHCAKNNVVIRNVPENKLNSLRVSTHIYNNRTEVDRLMELIKELV